ncbi:MAG: hypothetical protein ABWW66_06250 [Archaeoglobaceae archaeon]
MSLAKTLLPLLFGIVAGTISYFITLDVRSRDPFGIVVLVFFIYIQKFVLSKFGKIDAKDWLGISFMTFAGWYMSWVFLLNSLN